MPESLLSQAEAAFKAGADRRALSLAREALRLQPDASGAWIVIANAASRLGLLDEAIAALNWLCRRHPHDARFRSALATALNNRGSRQREAGNAAAALNDFSAATGLNPRHPQAWFNAAMVLSDLHRQPEALNALWRHLALSPNDDEARLLAAKWARGSHPNEVPALLAGLTGTTHLAAAVGIAGDLDRHGEPAAKPAYQTLWQLSGHGAHSPGLRADLGRLLGLPAILPSSAAIAGLRERFSQALNALAVDWSPATLTRCEPVLEQIVWCNFKLAYHGENDRELQRKFAVLLQRAAVCFRPDLAEPPARHNGTKKRVGLLSSCWRDCTVGVYFGGWLSWLRNAECEVFLYQLGPRRDVRTEELAATADHFYFHEGPLDVLADRIRGDRLDLLIYPELGMEARLLPLAALQLAQRQTVAWGHPVTSGFSRFDGYFTCADMEPDGACGHYVEPLLPLPGLGVDYTRPPEATPRSRAALGLPEHNPLVLLPQTLFKLHPDGDAALAAIAARVPACRFVLFADYRPWVDAFTARLKTAFDNAGADLATRLIWRPQTDRETYLAINAACDLMLDSPHWSGGNSSLDAFHSGLPVLTRPGRFMRGRQTWAMLRWMDLEAELAAANETVFIERAVALLSDGEQRRTLQARLQKNRSLLYESAAARKVFIDHIAALCNR